MLGFVVGGDKLMMDWRKVSAIVGAPWSTSKTKVIAFLGIPSYYTRFIAGFARTVGPFHELAGPHGGFAWTKGHEKAFEELKRAVTSAPVLAQPQLGRMFSVHTDASATAVGAVLPQDDDGGTAKSVHFTSRTLQSAERRYSTYDREVVAVVFALKKFRHWLLGAEFIVYSNHQSLPTAFTGKDVHGRIARWLALISEYTLMVRHTPGRENWPAAYLAQKVQDEGGGGELDVVHEFDG